jgi:hypothetical protein
MRAICSSVGDPVEIALFTVLSPFAALCPRGFFHRHSLHPLLNGSRHVGEHHDGDAAGVVWVSMQRLKAEYGEADS